MFYCYLKNSEFQLSDIKKTAWNEVDFEYFGDFWIADRDLSGCLSFVSILDVVGPNCRVD